ncbi:MAG: ABC transporter permease [Parasporobacterium sp.]|nr:ABC transporter permease [Parasporobacterium sp.]
MANRNKKQPILHISESRRVFKALFKRKIAVISAAVILLTIICAVFAKWVAPYDPYTMDLTNIKAVPSWEHLLGTDALGRDVLSRIIYGSQSALVVAIVSVLIAAISGIILGLLAGYFTKVVGVIIMRFVDTLQSIPMTVLALAIAGLSGGGLVNIVIAIGVSLTSLYARVMRGQVLKVKQSDYILAEKMHGAGNFRIMFLHILPNCIPVLIVTITMQMGSAILMEAGLSFLGIGITPPTPSWGSMVQDGAAVLTTRPLLTIAPGIAIFILVYAFNTFGDALRDALDPRIRNRK